VLIGLNERGVDLVIKGGAELDSPLDAGTVHLEESNTHEVDDDGGDEREDSFPDLLGLAPQVVERRVELAGCVFDMLRDVLAGHMTFFWYSRRR
jgi:hypothetical protein